MIPLQQSRLFNEALARLGVASQQWDTPSRPFFTQSRTGLPRFASRVSITPDNAHLLAQANVRIVNAATPACAKLLRANGYRQIVRPSFAAILQLQCARNRQRMLLKPKWRNRLQRAERQAKGRITLVSRRFCPTTDAWLITKEQRQQRARKYRNYPSTLTYALHGCAPHALRIFVAHDGREALAAMLFVEHESSATYYLGWSGPKGRAIDAHNLIMWHAITTLAERGARSLDLGLIETEQNAGLARFKLGTGAGAHELGGSWLRLVPRVFTTRLSLRKQGLTSHYSLGSSRDAPSRAKRKAV